MNARTLCLVMLAGMLSAAFAPSASAQAENGGNRQRGNFNPEEFRAQMETRMKERLAVNDDEWKVIQPKLEKVTNAQRAARSGGGFGGRRGGDGNRGGSEQPPSPVAKASTELNTTLDNKDASADEINAKLAALRDARAKAKTELEAAQKELKEVLTARQEAVFVSMGTLE